MVYQQTLSASETPSEGIALRRLLLNNKFQGTNKNLIFTDNFIAEVESFVERNLIENKEVCLHCLKAHMLNMSEAHCLHSSAKEAIETALPVNAGHMGYYLDKDEVKPVQLNLI